jgi:hypothetical protein
MISEAIALAAGYFHIFTFSPFLCGKLRPAPFCLFLTLSQTDSVIFTAAIQVV